MLLKERELVPDTDLDPVEEPERDVLGLTVPDTELVGEREAAERVAVIVDVIVPVVVTDTLGEPVEETDTDGDELADGDPVPDTLTVGLAVPDTVAELEAVAGAQTAGRALSNGPAKL